MAPYGLPQFCTTNEEADSVNKNTMIVNDDTDLEANNLPSDEDPHPRTPIHCRDCAYCKWFIFAERCYRIRTSVLSQHTFYRDTSNLTSVFARP
jgi:hypothetical protein